MEADTQEIQIPRKTLRQIRSDCQNAISDAHLAFADDSPVRLYCVDHAPETLAAYGRQLWYFDGQAINEDGKQSSLFGVLEYRLEYGLHELIERGVFDSVEQRDRFHRVYTHGFLRDPLWNTATLWLGAALVAMTVIASLLILWRLSPA